MKRNILTKVISLVTVLVLLFNFSAATISAGIAIGDKHGSDKPADKGTINYVSLGDSMANGFGFDGYDQLNENGTYDLLNGIGVYGQGAYPLQFEEYLTGKGYEVNHTKLAISGMLADNLLYLLGGIEEEFDDGWGGYESYIGGLDKEDDLMPFFQEAITNADIITFGVGNASFGA